MNKPLGFNPKNNIPQDIVAKRVVFDDGDHYNPKVKSNTHCYSTAMPSIRPMESLPYKVKRDPNFKDLTGIKKGYFTIVGLFDCQTFDKWVLRCSCGNYEIRTAKTINKIEDRVDQNCCQSCVDLERLRHKDYWQKHGIYPWQQRKS